MKRSLQSAEHRPDEIGIDLDALAPLLGAVGSLAVVDLETTGLADDRDAEILEFGLVLMDPGAPVLTTVRGLVRPSRPLPRAIERLTGLVDGDVADAPELREVVDSAAEALSGRVLVAHNANFEREFLSRFVDPRLADAVYLDTQDLLALTHPDAPDLRLESFTRILLGSEERHRALDDALDTARILSRIALGGRGDGSRYTTARRALERYAPESPWAALLSAEFISREDEPPQYVAVGPSAESPVPFDADAIAAALGDAERGARHFPGYRVRAEQIALARHFVETLSGRTAALVEGGTGVGKSLAYLSAAIPFAMELEAGGQREPLLVSTRTKLLQDQLLKKDIPAAAAFLGYPELRALSIKGRANYVCARRTSAVLAEGREPSMFHEDRYAFAVLMACAHTRPHGEVGTLPPALLRRYPLLRDLRRRAVAPRAEHCSREECARHRECPFGRRRAALARAHLIVANHDLLLRWPPDYPPFTHAVVDEGHELAGVADEVFAQVVRPDEVIERIDEIFGRPADKGAGDALLPRKKRRAAERDARAWRRAIYQDLTALGSQLAGRISEYGEVQLPANADRIFPEAAELADVAAGRIEQVADQAEALDERPEEGKESGVAACVQDLRDAARGLRTAFNGDPDVAVAAFEDVTVPFDRWRLAIRPVSPAEPFHEAFLDKLESFAAVSASLFVAGDPFAALGELEFEERSHLPVTHFSVQSPFPYAEHMRVVALDESGDLVEQTAEVIARVARILGGRTLGLFTSLRRMNQVAELLSRELRSDGFDILAPRRAGDDPAALVERFCRSGGGGVLLGARTFWQGLDIPGADLQAVVIEKLPFEVPTELRKRREARLRGFGVDPFERYALGKMLLYLKQMTGRLIRSEEDRGMVVIVEGRTQRRYFQSLDKALPDGVAVRVVRP
ncbi:MAG: exonuclease domain-containing protein, partial [Proteobacteria bacterium]|nr:exonuclease domain-containing protein [Pseudomonadota bacterium]